EDGQGRRCRDSGGEGIVRWPVSSAPDVARSRLTPTARTPAMRVEATCRHGSPRSHWPHVRRVRLLRGRRLGGAGGGASMPSDTIRLRLSGGHLLLLALPVE